MRKPRIKRRSKEEMAEARRRAIQARLERIRSGEVTVEELRANGELPKARAGKRPAKLDAFIDAVLDLGTKE